MFSGYQPCQLVKRRKPNVSRTIYVLVLSACKHYFVARFMTGNPCGFALDAEVPEKVQLVCGQAYWLSQWRYDPSYW
jgi:hypothetical protein